VSQTLIELRDVTKSYGSVFALGGVSLSVHQSEVVGLIGDNGAGKSTLIKILSGVVKPTSGEILVRGNRVTGWSAARSREAGIETVFQDRALCPKISTHLQTKIRERRFANKKAVSLIANSLLLHCLITKPSELRTRYFPYIFGWNARIAQRKEVRY
jgi:ABC-type sugar transport system ATPase subunit